VTTVIQDIQGSELLVAKELTPLARQEAVEAVPTNKVQVEVIGLKQTALVRAYTEHIEPPNDCSAPLYHIRRPGESFRLGF